MLLHESLPRANKYERAKTAAYSRYTYRIQIVDHVVVVVVVVLFNAGTTLRTKTDLRFAELLYVRRNSRGVKQLKLYIQHNFMRVIVAICAPKRSARQLYARQNCMSTCIVYAAYINTINTP